VKIVRAIVVVAAAVPRVEIDTAEVDHPEQRSEIVDDGEVDDVGFHVTDGAGADPIRAVFGRALHEEKLAFGAIGVALHHHGAILQVRQKPSRDVGIVLK
jgi:hypothetical protein